MSDAAPACKGKKHYDTIDKALEATKRAADHGAPRMRPYRCPDCLTAFRIAPVKTAIQRNSEARRLLGNSRTQGTSTADHDQTARRPRLPRPPDMDA